MALPANDRIATTKQESEAHDEQQLTLDTQRHEDPLSLLDPPQSCGESYRDTILRALDHPFFQYLGILVLVLVIADGALFFFLLIGAHELCRPRLDCQPRNEWYNASIQLLNILFTYMAVVSTPWRVTNLLHLTGCSCPRRSNEVGCNLYGISRGSAVSPEDLWYHIPPHSARLGITLLLLANVVFQFANQGTRIVYYDFTRQDTFPGTIWTNVFFAASFLTAGIAAVWLVIASAAVRRQDDRFGPGPIETVRNWLEKRENSNATSPSAVVSPDPTRDSQRRSVLLEDRGSLRMFAM